MDILIKNAKIFWSTSDLNGEVMDILITDGTIKETGKGLSHGKIPVIEGKNLLCMPGLCDIGTHSGEPGFEHRENFLSLSRSAMAGGYTHLVVFPHNKPVTQTRADILFILDNAAATGIQITPVGALSKDCKGVEIAEYFDMHSAGVRLFSDGLNSVADSGLLKRALQYATAINGAILHHPDDNRLSVHGEMHEGVVSTGLGMQGIPDIAEMSMLYRDILLSEYTGTRLISHAISSGGSLELIRQSYNKTSNIFGTVPYLNLILSDESLHTFDSNLKVNPVLRSASDRAALRNALQSEYIGAIVSNHVPLEDELKKVEFPYAIPGATGLETCLITCLSHLTEDIALETIIDKLTVNPRKILGIPVPELKKGAKAEMCIVESSTSYKYIPEHNKSLSKNNPFFGTEFKSKVVATVNGENVYLA